MLQEWLERIMHERSARALQRANTQNGSQSSVGSSSSGAVQKRPILVEDDGKYPH